MTSDAIRCVSVRTLLSVFGLADVFHGTVGRAPLLASLETGTVQSFQAMEPQSDDLQKTFFFTGCQKFHVTLQKDIEYVRLVKTNETKSPNIATTNNQNYIKSIASRRRFAFSDCKV